MKYECIKTKWLTFPLSLFHHNFSGVGVGVRAVHAVSTEHQNPITGQLTTLLDLRMKLGFSCQPEK